MPTTVRLFFMLAIVMVAVFQVATDKPKKGCCYFGGVCHYSGIGKRAKLAPSGRESPLCNNSRNTGKRAEVAPGGSESLSQFLQQNTADFQRLDILRQFCPLQPEQYLRLAPVFHRLASTISVDEEEGCLDYGGVCYYGGMGKRAEVAPGGSESLSQLLQQDTADFQRLDILRQFCSLQPEQYLRLAPVFHRLASTISADEENYDDF